MRRELDLILTPGAVPIAQAVRLDLGATTYAWVGTRAQMLGRDHLSPRDLAEMPVLMAPQGSDSHRTVVDWCETAGTPLRRASLCNSLAVLGTMVRKSVLDPSVSVSYLQVSGGGTKTGGLVNLNTQNVFDGISITVSNLYTTDIVYLSDQVTRTSFVDILNYVGVYRVKTIADGVPVYQETVVNAQPVPGPDAEKNLGPDTLALIRNSDGPIGTFDFRVWDRVEGACTVNGVAVDGDGEDLQIVLLDVPAWAREFAIGHVLQNLAFATVSDAPIVARTLKIAVDDPYYAVTTANITVNVTPQNDAPVITSKSRCAPPMAWPSARRP
ncbi:hypothetical protein DFH01_20490 [Falsiroseomonas bella]|uniref:LysR substrate-binding domain-containing protein n=1 Tax=Falsiroseomonas bella TaxID=2184016 RepID=A0A317F9X9_9PROT|nr:LysR substrate-binding domain-containing protein [Falsiroseomonas bella]PWS35940.1 hypothetical protein DFH01_20490 [Falsiroseomonas bella]